MTNNVFIIVLPCPEGLVNSFRVLLLMLGGDVETNSALSNTELSKQLDEVMWAF